MIGTNKLEDTKVKYEDIINLEHHVSKIHPQMSIEARAAQFAPFAALTGYSDAIKQTDKILEEKYDTEDRVFSLVKVY